MFELEIMALAPECARRIKRKSSKKAPAAKRGRGAPGKPKSAAHRKAISAGMRRYWGSKRASARRRSKGGAKRTSSKRSGGNGGTKTTTSKKAGTKRTVRKSTATSAVKPKAGKSKAPKPAHSKGAQVAMKAAQPRRQSLVGARRREDTRRWLAD